MHTLASEKEKNEMNFINWIIDSLASSDVIDAYFIQSDVVDINLTETEITENAALDELANETLKRARNDDSCPIGKKVHLMAEQLTLELESATDRLPESVWFQTFTIDTHEADAVAKFNRRFGHKPDEVYKANGLLWIGTCQNLEQIRCPIK